MSQSLNAAGLPWTIQAPSGTFAFERILARTLTVKGQMEDMIHRDVHAVYSRARPSCSQA